MPKHNFTGNLMWISVYNTSGPICLRHICNIYSVHKIQMWSCSKCYVCLWNIKVLKKNEPIAYVAKLQIDRITGTPSPSEHVQT